MLWYIVDLQTSWYYYSYKCDRYDTFAFTFVVVPSRRNVSTEVVRQLDKENVTIDCPLRVGSLYKNWTVRWNVTDENDNALPSNEYFYRMLDRTETDSKFQLVIRNAALKYEGARFQCRAVLDDVVENSQYITLRLHCK